MEHGDLRGVRFALMVSRDRIRLSSIEYGDPIEKIF